MADNTPPDLAAGGSSKSSDSLATVTPAQDTRERPRSMHSTQENTPVRESNPHDSERSGQFQGSYGTIMRSSSCNTFAHYIFRLLCIVQYSPVGAGSRRARWRWIVFAGAQSRRQDGFERILASSTEAAGRAPRETASRVTTDVSFP